MEFTLPLTVDLNADGTALVLIDQTKLPGCVETLNLTTQPDIWEAIYMLRVRGAPAIGIAAAIGVYLAAREINAPDFDSFYSEFKEKKDYLASARPTAVNLFWALARMERKVLEGRHLPLAKLKESLRNEALSMRDEDIAVCKAIGDNGVGLLAPGMGILTHCNAGTLATVQYGTATAPVYRAMEEGIQGIRVYCDETRPLLQGARLTAFELDRAGVDTCLICDNMAASIMASGKVQIVFTGCDRVARNGDSANKIGTSGVAILAKHFGIPFYICAPASTIDPDMPAGSGIEIEQRDPAEVTEMWYAERMAPEGIHVYNPAFDVTPSELISGIITEKGIARPPYETNFRSLGLF